MGTNRKKSESGIHWAWVILGLSFATLFINYSIRIGAYSVLLPEMIRDLGINMTEAGMIRAAYFLTYIFFSPVMGWLVDRIGGRSVISFFCLILGTGTFLMGKASTLSTAILFHAVVGMGAAAMWTPIVTLIQKWFGDTRRGLALGILSPSWALGFGLMGVVLPLIVKTYTWRTGWILLGISGSILVVMNALFLRGDPQEMGLLPWGDTSGSFQAHSLPHSSFRYRDILRGSHFWVIGSSYLFISIAAYIITDLIVAYGAIELKISYPIASAFITIMALTGIGGGFVLMFLSDYIGRKKSLVIIHLSVTLSIFLILFARGDVTLLRASIGCFGFFYGAIWPMYAACVRDYFPKAVAGTVIGLLTIFYGTGATLGPILAGYLTDVTGTFRWSFGLGASTALIAAVCIGLIKKREVLEKEED